MHLGSVDGRKNVQKGGTKQTDGICRTSLSTTNLQFNELLCLFIHLTPQKSILVLLKNHLFEKKNHLNQTPIFLV